MELERGPAAGLLLPFQMFPDPSVAAALVAFIQLVTEEGGKPQPAPTDGAAQVSHPCCPDVLGRSEGSGVPTDIYIDNVG